jgi:hypothetical protein
MKRRIGFVAGALTFLPCAYATDSGNELLDSCTLTVRFADGERRLSEAEQAKNVYCIGYIRGYTESLALSEAMGAKKNVCMPKDGVETGQLARVLVKYLRANPEKLHERGRALVYVALAEAFPCKR